MHTFITPKGETLVVLSEDEYQALLDKADIVAASKVVADIAAGRDELVPGDVAKRLLADENPVRIWREHRGLTARQLANKAGISAPYLSEIEAGKKDGSVAVMVRIADALGIEIGDLVA